MKKQKSKTGAGTNKEPDWVLLNEKAVTVEMDYAGIVGSDKMKYRTEGMPQGKLFEKYSSEISESVVSALKKLYPSKEVGRSMTAGTNRVKKIASVEAVTVFMIFDYDEKPTLNIRIIAEESDQSKVADEVRKIKKRFEEGK